MYLVLTFMYALLARHDLLLLRYRVVLQLQEVRDRCIRHATLSLEGECKTPTAVRPFAYPAVLKDNCEGVASLKGELEEWVRLLLFVNRVEPVDDEMVEDHLLIVKYRLILVLAEAG